MLMLYVYRATKCNLLFLCFILKYFKQSLPDILDPGTVLINLHPSTLDPGHVKHIVYDRQKKVSSLLQLLQMFRSFRQLFSFQFILHKLCIAQDHIHGSTDVMRHIVKETGLCETGILCFFQSDLQLVIELLCIIRCKLCGSFCFSCLS